MSTLRFRFALSFSLPFALCVAGALALAAPAPARAEPKVGVVVLSHAGLAADAAEAIAADVGTALQNRIEGTALTGAALRDKLPAGGVDKDCGTKPECGRDLAKSVGTDETLLLVMAKHKKATRVWMERVPRDPARAATHAGFTLHGPRSRQMKAVTESVASLYAPGSVASFVEPAEESAEAEKPVARAPVKAAKKPATAGASEAAQAADEAASAAADEEEGAAGPTEKLVPTGPPPQKPVYKKGWFIGVMTVAGALVVTGVVLGVTLGIPPSPSAPTITLP